MISRAGRLVKRVKEFLRRYRMHAYYVGTMVVGVLATSYPSRSGLSYSIAMLSLGAAGLWYRVRGRHGPESTVVHGLAVCALVQAVSIFIEVSDPGPLTEAGEWAVAGIAALRLMIEPLMMWDWSVYRRDADLIDELRRLRDRG